jgi:6-phosphogluconolactonase
MRATEHAASAIDIRAFADRAQLASTLAADVAGTLRDAIAARGAASLAVSGGSTPKAFFRALSAADLDWSKVTVTLVDERIVPPDHERSNARLVTAGLLTGNAAAANFVPLWSDGSDDPEVLADWAERAIDAIARPFDVVILGMGGDGHTASFFPDGDDLAEAIDPDCAASVVAMNAPGAGEPRLTITLPRLVEARFLALHIEGEEKRRVLDTALAGGPKEEMPIRAVTASAPKPLAVYFAP